MKRNVFIIILVSLFGLALYFPFLGKKEFQGEEGRRVLIALEMLEKGEYLFPQLFEEPYFNKPPLFNWALALFFKFTKDYSEFTARAFSSLSVIFTAIFLIFFWQALLNNIEKRTTLSLSIFFLPGLIFLTTPEVMDKALRAEIDAFYTMLITLGLFSWFYFYEIKIKKNIAFFLLGFFLGLGILTKTFQALLFFYLAYLPYFLIQKRWKEIFSFSHLLGLLTIIAIFLGWAIPVSKKIGLSPFIKAWLEQYLSCAKAKEMTPVQHFKSFTLSALLGFSPWIYFISFYLKENFRKFLKNNFPLHKLWTFSAFLFMFSYLFHFLFLGARLRYVLPSIGGLVFLSSLSIYYFFTSSYFPQKLKLFLSKILPLLSIFITIFFIFYTYFTSLEISPYFYLFYLLFIALNLFILLKNFSSFHPLFYYLIIYLFFIKQLYISFYYPLHQKEMNHFRKNAIKLGEIIKDKNELYLCKTVPHHLIYYLKYRFKLIDKINYLKTCDNLPEKSFILFQAKDYQKIKSSELKVIPLNIRTKSYYLIYTGKFENF